MFALLSLFGADCSGTSDVYDTCLPNIAADGDHLKLILQIVFGILTALAVLMITIGGLRLATSGGDPEGVKQARGTILYALVGLIIALSAEALVSFFLGRVG